MLTDIIKHNMNLCDPILIYEFHDSQTWMSKLCTNSIEITIDKAQENNTLEDISNSGRIRVTGESKAVLLKGELGSADVTFTEHGKLRWAPSKVGPTISSMNLLGQLWCEINLHLHKFTPTLKPKNPEREESDSNYYIKHNVWDEKCIVFGVSIYRSVEKEYHQSKVICYGIWLGSGLISDSNEDNKWLVNWFLLGP